MKSADRTTQIAAGVTIFELLADEPLDAPWLEKLLGTFLAPGLEWIILDVYEDREHELYQHVAWFVEKRKRG
jgi:hypothetical protein